MMLVLTKLIENIFFDVFTKKDNSLLKEIVFCYKVIIFLSKI